MALGFSNALDAFSPKIESLQLGMSIFLRIRKTDGCGHNCQRVGLFVTAAIVTVSLYFLDTSAGFQSEIFSVTWQMVLWLLPCLQTPNTLQSSLLETNR